MNCVMNGSLARESFVDNIFVQPASSDNGVSLGAAQLLSLKEGLIQTKNGACLLGS